MTRFEATSCIGRLGPRSGEVSQIVTRIRCQVKGKFRAESEPL